MKLSIFKMLALMMVLTACGKNHYLVQDPGINGANRSNIEMTSGGANGGSDNGGNNNNAIPALEKFTQNQQPQKKIDFLWVVDNSGSMAQEQENLAINFSSFIQDFLVMDVDFKMAITTTSTNGTACGKIITGSDGKLTSSKAIEDEQQFIEDFERLIKVRTSGSGDEKGLRASECFINTSAASFLRPDAYLAVIYISDEQDQSPKTTEYYLSKLQSVKGNPGLVKAYSIVNTTGQTFGQTLKIGYDRYDYMSSNTAGSTHDIFSSFYSSLLTIGEQIINLLDSFPLQYDPILDATLEVRVDGSLQTLDIHYTVENRAIKFFDEYLPPAESSITVNYTHH